MSDRLQLLDTLMAAIDTALANVHTATVAKVTAVNAKTIDCQPVIQRVVDGKFRDLPVFLDVPPIFLSGGSSALRMPIVAGDYCLLIFTERAYDRWWAGQDMRPPVEMRMHDYSDGFAIVGIKPESSALSIPGVTTFDGDLVVDGDLNVTGNIIAGGTVTASVDVIGGGISLKTHTHTGVTPGGGMTGPPA